MQLQRHNMLVLFSLVVHILVMNWKHLYERGMLRMRQQQMSSINLHTDSNRGSHNVTKRTYISIFAGHFVKTYTMILVYHLWIKSQRWFPEFDCNSFHCAMHHLFYMVLLCLFILFSFFYIDNNRNVSGYHYILAVLRDGETVSYNL